MEDKVYEAFAETSENERYTEEIVNLRFYYNIYIHMNVKFIKISCTI